MRALALLLLFAVATATASMPASSYTSTEGSSCWECHADGLWDPPMRGPEFQQGRFVQQGGQWLLEVDVHNPWTHEFLHVGGTLSPAPQAIAPNGSAVVTTETGTLSSLQPQIRVHEFTLLDEAQSVDINVDVTAVGPTGWTMTLQPAGGDSEDWEHTIDDGSATLSADDLAASGATEWVLTLTFSNSLSPQTEYEITITEHLSPIDAWKSHHGAAGINATATLQWPLNITQDMGETSLLMTTYAHAYYEHDDPVDDDNAWLTASEEILIAVDNGTPYFVEALEAEREAQEAEDEFVPGPGVAAVALGLVAIAVARRHQ